MPRQRVRRPSPYQRRTHCVRARPAVLVALTAGLAVLACVPPRSFEQVRQARPGNPLNERVCVVYSAHYQIHLAGIEKLHPFDINKYARIYLSLLTEGYLEPEDVFVPEPVLEEDLLRVHPPDYLESLRRPAVLARYLEFGPARFAPAGLTDAAILQPFRRATGGTVMAARLALEHGIAINLGGGYHHAGPERGGGFCIYADMPIAIRTLQQEGLISRALVIDLDAHQGNGTALCFEDDDDVFTFDMHEEGIYPHPKERNTLDVGLPSGTGDDAFLRILADHLPRVFDAARPDIVIYQAGVDALADDPLTNLRVTRRGIVERDRLVFTEAVGRDVPIVMVLGGGYSADAWRAQHESIRRIIEAYGLVSGTRRSPGREPTPKERLYTK